MALLILYVDELVRWSELCRYKPTVIVVDDGWCAHHLLLLGRYPSHHDIAVLALRC